MWITRESALFIDFTLTLTLTLFHTLPSQPNTNLLPNPHSFHSFYGLDHAVEDRIKKRNGGR
jgi:hypothetical protein